MRSDWEHLDFKQPFNRGASMRELGMSVDAVILEDEDKAEWIKGWLWQDGREGCPPVIWRLVIS